MAKTTHFGLNKFGAEGRLADEGYKFSLKDRELFDALFWTLYNHDHRDINTDTLAGFASTNIPDLTLITSGGTLPAGQDYYYKISYLDASNNETAASPAAFMSTPDPIPAPAVSTLATATTGGTLEPGTYKYALSYYQTTGETTAPNISTIIVPTGTSTNTITIPLPTIHDDATGWKLYRKGPGDLEYWYLDLQAAPATDYVDDGSISPDCTKRRPLTNTTNTTNKVTVAIPAGELPLDTRVASWRIYRTNIAGVYGSKSLLATVVETTTEGGSDLVTTYTDAGGALYTGTPLSQTAVPPAIPQLDAGDIFELTGGRLNSALAPLGVRTFNLLLPGTLVVQDYHQFVPPHDILLERIDGFYLLAATGVDGANYVTVRISDDSAVNEIQHIWNDSTPQDEIQRISNDATSGTFTLSFDGQGPTGNLDFDSTAAEIETALELFSNITDVVVAGNGTASDPWVIQFADPGEQGVAEITADDTNLVGGTTTITTSIQGSDGGTFTLSDGTDTTSAIAYDAVAATIETRLETDITSITAVTVTGAGTEGDPWIVEFVTPGSTDVDMLIADDGSLNGTTTITEEVEGHGATTVDLDIITTAAVQNWQSSTTDEDSFEAEDETGGTQVSDTLALNDVAMELDAQTETNTATVGFLDPGDYRFRFWVSDYDKTSTFKLSVIDADGGPATLVTETLTPARSTYTPYYELKATLDGTENIEMEVEKTDTGTDRVRVDKYEYIVDLPTLHAGATCIIEVLTTGSPTTTGDDLQLTYWY